METLKFGEQKIATIRDAHEFMISTDYNDEKYIALVDISGMREAIERMGIRPLIEKSKKQFENDIINNKVKPSDRVKYCFWRDGDFIIYPKNSQVNIKARVSRYAGDRLHIEIKKEYRDLFNEGNEVTIIKK